MAGRKPRLTKEGLLLSRLMEVINTDGRFISVKISKHAEERSKERNIPEDLIINEFNLLSLSDIKTLQELPKKEIVLYNVDRDISIVFRINGFKVFIITVIDGVSNLSNMDVSYVYVDKDGDIISLFKGE